MENKKLDKPSIGDCPLCKESKLNIGQKTPYGAVIIYKMDNLEDGWFATLSPKTLGNPKKDFTIQIMPLSHIRHISQIDNSETLSINYGRAFAKISKAINEVMKDEGRHNENEENMIRIGTYGKSKHPEEHFHIKLFPWEHSYVVDTTFENKEIRIDEKGNKFVKMAPIRKSLIDEERLNYLAEKIIKILNE